EGDIFHRSLSIDENSQFEGSSRRGENPTDPSSSVDAKGPQKSPQKKNMTPAPSKDWGQRGGTNPRRHKVEDVLAAMHDCEAYVDRFRLKSMNGQPVDERDPARELNSIATLYCRELRTEVRVACVPRGN